MLKLKRNEELLILGVFFIIGIVFLLKNVVFKEQKASVIIDKTEDEKILSTTEPQKIYVYITGEVKRPGVYELKSQDRVEDIINAAGGFTDNADTSSVNLAQKLKDEQQINVASKNASGETSSNSSIKGGKININTASAEELDSFLPYIGSTLAKNIVDYRNKNGKFKSVDEITKVSGIGSGKRYQMIKDLISVN